MHEARSRHTRDSVEQPLRAAAYMYVLLSSEVRTDEPDFSQIPLRTEVRYDGGYTATGHSPACCLYSLLFTLTGKRHPGGELEGSGGSGVAPGPLLRNLPHRTWRGTQHAPTTDACCAESSEVKGDGASSTHCPFWHRDGEFSRGRRHGKLVLVRTCSALAFDGR